MRGGDPKPTIKTYYRSFFFFFFFLVFVSWKGSDRLMNQVFQEFSKMYIYRERYIYVCVCAKKKKKSVCVCVCLYIL